MLLLTSDGDLANYLLKASGVCALLSFGNSIRGAIHCTECGASCPTVNG